jgi:hypothetical protein
MPIKNKHCPIEIDHVCVHGHMPCLSPILSPAELAENSASADLEQHGWWKDVVEQYENKKGQGKRSYASQQVLFDLAALSP